MKDMRRAERRHRTRMARRRRFRLVRELCGVNPHLYAKKVSKGYTWGEVFETFARHRWERVRLGEERALREEWGGSLQERQAFRACGSDRDRGVSGRVDSAHFDLIGSVFRERVMGVLRLRTPDRCSCELERHYLQSVYGDEPWTWAAECEECCEMGAERHALIQRWESLDLGDGDAVGGFLLALREYRDRYFYW